MSILKSTLQEAIIVLTSHENAKTRLTNAWVDRLDSLSAEDLPDSIREQFKTMRDKLMTRQPVNGEHPIVATIRKMSPMEASGYGQDIVNMYIKLVNAELPVQLRLVETKDAEQVLESGTTDAVPDFLTKH